MYSNGELFMHSRECYILVLFPEWRSNEGNKHQNNTRMTEKTVRRESTEIISFLAWHNEAINDEKKPTICTHRPRVSLTRFTFC